VVVSTRDDLPIKASASRAAWEEWLRGQHATAKGVWLKIARKDATVGSVSYPEALEVAICYGWIDGQKAAYDEGFWLQRFTPRKPTSRWSKINRDKAVELIEQGLMQPAGLREVERAQADGRWEAAYAGQRTAAVPDDLQRELDRHAAARALFASLDSRNRYAILYRIQDAKRPETRRRRIETFVAMLNEGRTLYPSSGGAGPGQRRR
jgi:uncharacterized protein YdeI (YjbR/CyaY-like superfamily)